MASTISGHDRIPGWTEWTQVPVPKTKSVAVPGGTWVSTTWAETFAQWYLYPPTYSPVDNKKMDGPTVMNDNFRVEVKLLPIRSWVAATIFPSTQDGVQERDRKRALRQWTLSHERGHYFITAWLAQDLFNDVVSLIKPTPTVFPNPKAADDKYGELLDLVERQRDFLNNAYDAVIHQTNGMAQFAQDQTRWDGLFVKAQLERSMRNGWKGFAFADLDDAMKANPPRPDRQRFPVTQV